MNDLVSFAIKYQVAWTHGTQRVPPCPTFFHALQQNVWRKIMEEILPRAGSSIIRAALAMKHRWVTPNNGSYLVYKTKHWCIYHISCCTVCDSLNHPADTRCWPHLRTRCSVLESSAFRVLFFPGVAPSTSCVSSADVFRSTSSWGLPPEGWVCCISGRKAADAKDTLKGVKADVCYVFP